MNERQPPPRPAAASPAALSQILACLQEALTELDVWRQHARDPAEWIALRRMASALADAQSEVQSALDPTPPLDPDQQSLLSLD